MLVLLVGGFLLFEVLGGEEAVKEIRTAHHAQEIAKSLQADGVTIRREGEHGLVAEGFVATSELQRKLRQALLEAQIGVKYRVVNLEQQVHAARTIVSTAGAQVTVEGDAKTGKIVLEGFMPDGPHAETLERILRRDIPELRPLESRIATPTTIAAEARAQLAAAGLAEVTQVAITGTTIRISGNPDEPGKTAVRGIADKLNARWAPKAKVEDATGGYAAAPVAASPAPAPAPVTVRAANDRFTVIVAGSSGFIIDTSGRRFIVGDKLANGEVIEEIRVDEIVTNLNGVKMRHTFGGGR